MSSIPRSKALLNIPQRKLQEQILHLIQNCKDCSLKNIKTIANVDNICERCSVKIIAYNRYYESNIPIEYWSLSMNDFKGPDILKKVYSNSIDNLQSIYVNGLNYALLGTSGIGKTTVATAILKKMAEKNYSCLYITLMDMVNVLIEAPFEEKYIAKRELTQADLLIIDELDSRFFATTENTANLFAKTLEGIIRTRFSNKLPNIFISNSPNILEGFNGAFKDSLSSLMSNVKEFVARGTDFRKTMSNVGSK